MCSTTDGMIVKRMAPDGTLYSVNPERPFEHYEDKNVRIVGIVTGVAEEEDFPEKKKSPSSTGCLRKSSGCLKKNRPNTTAVWNFWRRALGNDNKFTSCVVDNVNR